MLVLVSQRSSAFTQIVCFHIFMDRLLSSDRLFLVKRSSAFDFTPSLSSFDCPLSVSKAVRIVGDNFSMLVKHHVTKI